MSKKPESLVQYKGKFVPKNSFRAFVHNAEGQYLANSYEEFEALIASKEWYVTKAEALKPKPKPKLKKAKTDDADSPGVCE